MPRPDDIRRYVEELTGAGAPEILAWAADRFPGRIVLASSLGIEDQVLTSMIADGGLDIPVFTLDTGRLYQESYDLLERTRLRYGMTLTVMFPDSQAVEDMVAEHGTELFRQSEALRKRCCEVRKLQPLRRALAGSDAWVCGLRRGQSVTRVETAPVEWDEPNGLVKVNPLWDWDDDQLAAHASDNDVPVSALHAQGFPSIGCAPCTRAVGPGEDIRAGRWWWESPEHKECGLHSRRVGHAPSGTEAAGGPVSVG